MNSLFVVKNQNIKTLNYEISKSNKLNISHAALNKAPLHVF